MRPSPDSWEIGHEVARRFLVERRLGRGGFGQVDLVRDIRSGALHAVKRLLVAGAAEQGQIITEAERWINLPAHPNIVGCHFVRVLDDQVAVFAEYVDGGSLADRLRTGPRLALGEALDVAIQTARGLHQAHALGVVHLDVKPSNVLIASGLAAKVADFGLAAGRALTTDESIVEEQVLEYLVDEIDDADVREPLMAALRAQLAGPNTGQTVVAGGAGFTPAYASLEQAEGRALTRASDVWSWGLTVLESIIGERTWPSGTVAAAVLASLAAEIPGEIADILAACFADEPTDRPASLDAVADGLVDIHARIAGREYERPKPPITSFTDALDGRRVRVTSAGANWGDPRLVVRGL